MSVDAFRLSQCVASVVPWLVLLKFAKRCAPGFTLKKTRCRGAKRGVIYGGCPPNIVVTGNSEKSLICFAFFSNACTDLLQPLLVGYVVNARFASVGTLDDT